MRGQKALSVAVGLAGAACAAYAALAARSEPRLELHERDWPVYEEGLSRRSYRGLSHFLYHLRELLGAQVPLAGIYLGRALEPAFRERIMLVTAMANRCWS